MIDYSKYSTDELLDVKNRIDSDSSNYDALISELDKRKNEIELVKVEEQKSQYLSDKLKIKTVGLFQIAGAVVLSLMMLHLAFTGPEVPVSIFLVAFLAIVINSVAGITALKQMSNWYWVSLLNQGLQLFSFGLGSYYVNYAGLGFVGGVLGWGGSLSFQFKAAFSPGFNFLKATEPLSNQFIGVDILAILFILAFIRLKESEERT